MSTKVKLTKLLLIALMLVSGLGISSVSLPKQTSANNIEVWSTYNTVKVNQDYHNYEKQTAEINLSMAQGETEGAQIIITPQKNINSFNVVTKDLTTNEGDVFSTQNVKVFKQHYLYQPQKSDFNNNENVPAGYVPDMLLPIEIANDYNETFIKAEKNQGITFEFTSTSQTVSGIYTGEYDLILNGKTIKIAVTVTVHDVDITASQTKSSFIINRIHLMRGEADGSIEMYEKYFKLLLDNKVTATYAPGFDISPKLMADYIIKYWDNPAFTSYSIPTRVSIESYSVNIAIYSQFLRELVQRSTPEQNLVSRATCYVLSLDEPQAINTIDGSARVQREISALKAANNKVFNQVVENGLFDKYDSAFKTSIKQSIDNIQFLITSPYNSRFDNVDVTYVPQFQHYETYDEREAIFSHAQKFDNELWWYGCISPKYPWPTYHIDDYLQGARAVGWMQKYNKITGNLYWGVNTSFQWNNNLSNNMVMVDPYENPIRFISAAGGATGVAGEGYLLYPTTKYQTETPLSSLRLSAIRDGNDDYDLICALEDVYAKRMSEYGLSQIEINNTLKNVFNDLFTQSKYHHDGSLIYAAREVLFELITAAKSDAGIVFEGNKFNDGVIEAIFYSKASSATINGSSLTGTVAGNVFSYRFITDLNKSKSYADAVFLLDNKSYGLKVLLGYYTSNATGFSSNLKDGLELSATSTMTVNYQKKSADLIIKSQGKTDIEKRLFKPGFSILISKLGENANKLKDVQFLITNTADKAVTFRINLVADYLSKEINIFTLSPGETKIIEINNIYLTDWSSLSSLNKIFIYCDNIDSNKNLLPNRTITVSEVYYSVVGD